MWSACPSLLTILNSTTHFCGSILMDHSFRIRTRPTFTISLRLCFLKRRTRRLQGAATMNNTNATPIRLRQPARRINRIMLSLSLILSIVLVPIARADDCNSNGLDDAADIAGGTSTDCDTNGLPDECEGVLFVDDSATNGLNDGSSWDNAFVYLRDALSAADANCAIGEIWVAAGTYKPDQGGGQTPGDRSATFQLQSGLALHGGFNGTESSLDQRDLSTNRTILSGDLLGDDLPDFENMTENSQHVVTGSGTDSTAILDGVTISAGYADTPMFDGPGGGMLNEAGNPTLVDCRFIGNQAYDGAGMANFSSSPSLTRCAFERNKALLSGTAVLNAEQSHATFANCEFRNNLSAVSIAGPFDAGGMQNLESSPSITACQFIHDLPIYGHVPYGIRNSGSDPTITDCSFAGFYVGIENNENSSPAVSRSRFSKNLSSGMTNGTGIPTITGCYFTSNGVGGIMNSSCNAIIANCVFNGNFGRAPQAAGISNHVYSSPLIVNCTFTRGIRSSTGVPHEAIANFFHSSPTIANCVFWDKGQIQIRSLDGSAPVVNYSIVQGGWSGAGGIGIIDADPLFVDSNGPDGIAGTEDDDLRLQPGSPALDAGDNSAVPVGIVTDHSGADRFVDDVNTPDTGVGPAPIVDMGAYEFQAKTVLYVDDDATSGANNGSSWADAYVYLQDALLDAATNGVTSQIWVAAGTYKPDEGGGQTLGDRTATFQLQSGLAIYGGFAGFETTLDERSADSNATVLSGDLMGDDLPNFGNYDENALHVLTGSGTDETAVLDGFTVTSGNANGVPLWGGGMLNDAGHPTIDHCVFKHNLAGVNQGFGCCGGGGGVANIGSAPTIRNSRFNQNKAVNGGGICNIDQSDPIIEDCVFEGNANFGSVTSTPRGGAGIQNEDSSPMVSRCRFVRNEGGQAGGILNALQSNPTIWLCDFESNGPAGIENDDASDAIIDSCLFIRNDGIGVSNTSSQPTISSSVFLGNELTGMVNTFSDAAVTNCVFDGNGTGSTKAGGMYTIGSAPLVTNCTFANNAVSIGQSVGGGIHNIANSSPIVTNCIFWKNTPGQIEEAGNSPVVNWSIVQGGWSGDGGVGIIDADPLFVDSNGPDNFAGTEDDDLRLLPGSSAIDAGDNSAVPVDGLTDLDGHARFVDDISTADMGVGVAPVVDIGAYEFVLGDCDADGNADLDDHAILSGCLTSPGTALGVGCACLDLDSDGDVDLRDFARFQRGFFN